MKGMALKPRAAMRVFLTALLALLLPVAATAQVLPAQTMPYGAGRPSATDLADTYVFGTGFRTIGASNLLAPDSTRVNELGDVYLPAQPAGTRIVFANFGLNSGVLAAGSPRELMPGNTNTIDFAVLFTGANGTGTATTIRFASATSVTMADGGFAISDPLASAFPGGWLRYSITTPAGGQRPRGFTGNSLTLSETRRNNTAPVPSAASGGSITSTGISANTSNGYLPLGVLVPYSTQPSILLIGDSIIQQDDNNLYFADARNIVGGIARGLDANTTEGRFTVGNFAHHGVSVIDMLDVTPGSLKFSQRYALLSYIRNTLNGGKSWPFHAIWSQGLRNDFSNLSGATDAASALVQMKARAQSWWDFLRATFPGVPIIQSTITPRTTDTAGDGRTTIAGQSVNPSLYGGIALEQFHDWVMTRPSPLALAVDLRSVNRTLNGAGEPVWPLTAFTLAGGGTLATAITASSTNYSSTGIRITTATAPIVGNYVVLEPGGGSQLEVPATQITSVTNNGDGTYTIKLSSGTAAKSHSVGVAVRTTYSQDGTHPSSAMQVLMAAPVQAVKAQVPFLAAR